jgi:hypothetical protein
MNTKCSMHNQPSAVHPGPPTRSKKKRVRIQRLSYNITGQVAKGGTACEARKKKHGWGGFTPDAAYDRLLYVQSMSQIRHRIRPNTTLSGTLAHSCTDSK